MNLAAIVDKRYADLMSSEEMKRTDAGVAEKKKGALLIGLSTIVFNTTSEVGYMLCLALQRPVKQ